MSKQYGCRVSSIIDKTGFMMRYSTEFVTFQGALIEIANYEPVGKFYLSLTSEDLSEHRWRELKT